MYPTGFQEYNVWHRSKFNTSPDPRRDSLSQGQAPKILGEAPNVNEVED